MISFLLLSEATSASPPPPLLSLSSGPPLTSSTRANDSPEAEGEWNQSRRNNSPFPSFTFPLNHHFRLPFSLSLLLLLSPQRIPLTSRWGTRPVVSAAASPAGSSCTRIINTHIWAKKKEDQATEALEGESLLLFLQERKRRRSKTRGDVHQEE